MVKIRLSRIGAKGQPYYRVVVVDRRKKRDGSVIEIIGRYNPRTEPTTFEIDKDRLKHWRGVGAQVTEAVAVLLGEAKPKFHKPKEKKEEAVAPTVATPSPTPTEGAAEVKVDAPETTPEPSAELAKTEQASSSLSPAATSEEVAETIEKTEPLATETVAEERQPTTEETKVDQADIAAEGDSPEEVAQA